MHRNLQCLCAVALLGLAACDVLGPGSGTIAGEYRLVAVDGQGLPWQAPPDSLGERLTVVSGLLDLGPAQPVTYAYPPSGVPMASSCIHEIPNGAVVDTAGVVHLPDGTSYRLPPCGDGPYALSITGEHTRADGTSVTAAETVSGLYTWGTGAQRDPIVYVTLVGAGMGGGVTQWTSGVSTRIALAVQHVGPPIGPPEPIYEFARSGP